MPTIVLRKAHGRGSTLLIALLLVAGSFVLLLSSVAVVLAQGSTTPPTANGTVPPVQSATPDRRTAYLPIIRNAPTPTPTRTPVPTSTPSPAPRASVYVNNETGGNLCYEVQGTGIGRQCFSSGLHYYGSFPAGTYSWRASARCGSTGGTRYFAAEDYVVRFWCSASAASSQSAGLRISDD